ncbi:Type cbb3 cytochrome oxidase biogenesis protein CcoG, involved in Cu oxidation [hydrothermal vent metagenome]|uniref:Type cbb3 cytochrome oxidase biogenesis protein CcoG, involved in Cu oxidation n=1 Tax=hydrothermal vent metagenome TaxID=652676 RepID=A0A3B0XL93_9ZZZZ
MISENKGVMSISIFKKTSSEKNPAEKPSEIINDVNNYINVSQAQYKRRGVQAFFFILFILAPVLDIFRFDLNQTHFVLFGSAWTLGLEPFLMGQATPGHAVMNIILRGFLPLAGLLLLLGWVSWKYGRLYCGWMCPHFSVVETINNLMRRASGKLSIWDRKKLPEKRPDGRPVTPNKLYWLLVFIAVAGFSFLWAVVLLTYLLPPAEIYSNLFHAELTPNQTRFIAIGSALLTIEFMFARHLFCRFGCAVGVFQSFIWMANPKAMVVSFQRQKAYACQDCGSYKNDDNNKACDDICPMRLKPRTIKRSMFTCTQCAQCLTVCNQVQGDVNQPPVIRWQPGQDE